jgi:hypothetical protein
MPDAWPCHSGQSARSFTHRGKDRGALGSLATCEIFVRRLMSWRLRAADDTPGPRQRRRSSPTFCGRAGRPAHSCDASGSTPTRARAALSTTYSSWCDHASPPQLHRRPAAHRGPEGRRGAPPLLAAPRPHPPIHPVDQPRRRRSSQPSPPASSAHSPAGSRSRPGTLAERSGHDAAAWRRQITPD